MPPELKSSLLSILEKSFIACEPVLEQRCAQGIADLILKVGGLGILPELMPFLNLPPSPPVSPLLPASSDSDQSEPSSSTTASSSASQASGATS